MASINLTWAASAGASSGTYRIKYWRSTAPDSIVVIEPVSGTSYTITDKQVLTVATVLPVL